MSSSTSTPAAHAATGDVTITGHGYGHGRGLSQWGAYGYATTYRWNHLQILAHYYGNATTGDIGNPLMTVRLTALDGIAPQVTSQANFTAAGWSMSPGTAVQFTPNPDGTWQMTTMFGCNGAVGGTVQVNSTLVNTVADPGDDITEMLTVCDTGRTYRGALSVVSDNGALRTVNTVFMQDYLRAVVPRESPASWGSAAGGAGLNALMAQAVAARSYAWSENRTSYAKTCDTTACQVYGGAGLNNARIEDSRSDYAVANTDGEVMMLGGQVARTEFSSSSGGYTAGGTFPAVPDDGDLAASPYVNWSQTVAGADIASAFGVGALQSLTVLSRNGLGADGGRVTMIRITGSSKSVDVSGSSFRSALGLKSDWFTPGPIQGPPQPPPWPRDVSPVTVSAVRTSLDTVLVFVRGTDGALYYTTAKNGAFTSFQRLPAATKTGPAAVTTDGRLIDVFAVGTDQALWHTSTTVDASGLAGTFAAWDSLGGSLTSAPSAASNADGDMIVTARGADGGVWSRAENAGNWSAWQAAGGNASSAPSAEVVDGSTYRLRVVGADGAIWSRDVSSRTGAATTGWGDSGQVSGFAPAVSGTNWATLGVRALAVSRGSGVRQLWADGHTVDIGGSVTSAVSMIEWGSTSTWTFARGGDGALWLNVVSNPTAPSAWYPVGGRLA